MVCTGDSDITSSCEMNDEPALKPMQRNAAYFRVRESRCPFHLSQQMQGPSHIPIAEGSLLLSCLLKVGLALQSKPGNKFSSRDDMGCTELFSCCCAEIGVPLDLDGYIRESLVFPKGRKASCRVCCGMRDGSRANRVESGFILS